MSRFQNCGLPGLLLATVIAVGCAESPTAPTNSEMTGASTAPGATAAKNGPSLTEGFYQMVFLDRFGAEVTTLPLGYPGSNLRVRVHVEDSNHQPAQDGSVLFEMCRWKGVSPTTGTRHGAAPSERCADGSARWVRHIDTPINPLTGNAQTGIDFVNVLCVMGWRATYRGSRTIAQGVMGPADITWQ